MHTGAQDTRTEAGPRTASAAADCQRLAPETLRLYARDWAEFSSWCRTQGANPLPATADQVASYLAGLAGTLGRSALDRRRAAITHEHRRRGLAAPAAAPATRVMLRASRGTPRRRRIALPTLAQLPRIIATCPGDFAGLRDRALLLLLIAGRLPRAILTGLQTEQVRFTDSGVIVTVEATADAGTPDGHQTVCLPRNLDRLLCPVLALEDWLRASGTRYGPVFRKVDRWGNVEHRPLGTDAVRVILARRSTRQRPPRAGEAG